MCRFPSFAVATVIITGGSYCLFYLSGEEMAPAHHLANVLISASGATALTLLFMATGGLEIVWESSDHVEDKIRRQLSAWTKRR